MVEQTSAVRRGEPTILRFVASDVVQAADNQRPCDHGLSAEMTLAEFYERYVKPIVLEPRGAAERNLKQFDESLRYWRTFTGDPPLQRIDEWVCAAFVAGVSRMPGRRGPRLAPNTIRKHCTQLQRLLDLAGPRSRQNRSGRGLLDDVPYLERPPQEHHEPEDVFTIEELSAWLDACRHAKRPRIPGLRPPVFWRSLVKFIYNVGTRIKTTILLEWSMVDGDVLRVPPRLRGRPDIYKGNTGKTFTLNEAARDALAAVRTADKRLFPWPLRARSIDSTLSYVQKVRRELLALTDIPPQRRFGFHGIRRLTATELAGDNPLVAQKQLGHTAMAVTRDSYVARRVVEKSLGRLRQPKTGGDDRQMRLF
jgi:integrase